LCTYLSTAITVNMLTFTIIINATFSMSTSFKYICTIWYIMVHQGRNLTFCNFHQIIISKLKWCIILWILLNILLQFLATHFSSLANYPSTFKEYYGRCGSNILSVIKWYSLKIDVSIHITTIEITRIL